MLAIDVQADITPAIKLFKSVERQLPYATARAINTTLVDAQKEIRRGLGQRFTLRRRQFVERTIKMNKPDFATKNLFMG